MFHMRRSFIANSKGALPHCEIGVRALARPARESLRESAAEVRRPARKSAPLLRVYQRDIARETRGVVRIIISLHLSFFLIRSDPYRRGRRDTRRGSRRGTKVEVVDESPTSRPCSRAPSSPPPPPPPPPPSLPHSLLLLLLPSLPPPPSSAPFPASTPSPLVCIFINIIIYFSLFAVERGCCNLRRRLRRPCRLHRRRRRRRRRG